MEPPLIENVKMIIVEDDGLLRETLKDIFEFFLNRRVLVFEDGKRAWNYIQQNQVDIILSDIDMPEMNGLELLRRVKGQCPEIIVVNMSGKSNNLAKAKDLGSNQTILKPFELKDLIQIVQDFISGD